MRNCLVTQRRLQQLQKLVIPFLVVEAGAFTVHLV